MKIPNKLKLVVIKVGTNALSTYSIQEDRWHPSFQNRQNNDKNKEHHNAHEEVQDTDSHGIDSIQNMANTNKIEPRYGIRPNTTLIAQLSSQIAMLVKQDIQCVLVTSGAVGFGATELGLVPPIQSMMLKQACAALGQPRLMQEYRRAFAKHKLHCAQLLVTRQELNTRLSYNYLAQCIELLLNRSIIPIINENDTIAIEELDNVYGDNDRLASSIAAKLGADLLLMLSDVDGLYAEKPSEIPQNESNTTQKKEQRPEQRLGQKPREKPREKPDTQHEVTAPIQLRSAHKGPYVQIQYQQTQAHIARLETQDNTDTQGSNLGSGGILTKLYAAATAQRAGCNMVLTSATIPEVIVRVVLSHQNIGTLFLAEKIHTRRQSWIAQTAPKGTITIDEGAIKAIFARKSLLLVGVLASKGKYQKGDVLVIDDKRNAKNTHTDITHTTNNNIANKENSIIKLVTLLSSEQVEHHLVQKEKKRNTMVSRADDIVWF